MNEQMKQYTGTKTVKAMPMAMGEAYERKLLKEGVRPSECETDKAGYLVEYEGGYQSWSPKSIFDEAYKCADTFLDRLKVEYEELMKRYEKCAAFVDSEKFRKVVKEDCPAFLLSLQRKFMGYYLVILEQRMAIAKGEISITTLTGMSFGSAIQALKFGLAIRRTGWNGKGLFVVKQVPDRITGDIIPNMQSLPQSAKDIIMARAEPHIAYTNQMLIIHPDGRADSWVPSSSDIFAEDWELVTE